MVSRFTSDLARRLREERGQGLTEYALIIALVAIVLTAALTGLQGGIAGTFATITAALNP